MADVSEGSTWSGEQDVVPIARHAAKPTTERRADSRTNASSYSPPPAPRPAVADRSTPATFSLAVFLTMVSGVALMFGSVGTWIHVRGSLGIATFHVSVNGIDQGITALITTNGYVTFIGGIVLLVFGGLAMTSEERLLAILTTLVSLAILVFAAYDMFRIVQKISQLPALARPSVSVGWGLICVLSAAVLATIVSLARLLGQR